MHHGSPRSTSRSALASARNQGVTSMRVLFFGSEFVPHPASGLARIFSSSASTTPRSGQPFLP